MTTSTCPNGHQSSSSDYCDTCGAPMGASGGGTGASGDAGSGAAAASGGAASGGAASGGAGSGAAASGGVASQTCANCGVENVPDALFCEACGYDFTTGAMPRVPSPVPSQPVSSLDLGAPSGTPGAGGGAAAAAPDPGPIAPPVPLEWVVEAWVDPDWHAEQADAEPCPSPGLPRIIPLTVRSVLIGRTSRSRNINPEIECSPDNGVSRRHAQLTTDGSRWWIEDLQSSNGTYVGPASGPLPTTGLTPGIRQELREGDRIYVGAWTRLVVRRATADEKAGQA